MRHLFIAFILTILLYSCGSDNNITGVNPPPSNNDSLIFSFSYDSILTQSLGIYERVIWNNPNSTQRKFRVKFTMYSNDLDTTTYPNATVFDFHFENTSTTEDIIQRHSPNLNVTIDTTFTLPTDGKKAVYNVSVLNHTPAYYVVIKNFAFYKVN